MRDRSRSMPLTRTSITRLAHIGHCASLELCWHLANTRLCYTIVMSQQHPNLRVRINQIDYVLQPSGALDNSALPRVPVIRIYGESSVGRKACVHVHQVYPYFYLEYTDKMDSGHGAF